MYLTILSIAHPVDEGDLTPVVVEITTRVAVQKHTKCLGSLQSRIWLVLGMGGRDRQGDGRREEGNSGGSIHEGLDCLLGVVYVAC